MTRADPQHDVNRAWERYAKMARAVRQKPELLSSRKHNEAMLRAHRDFAALFLAQDGGRA